MPDFDRGAALMLLFEARGYDLASKSDRNAMAAIINEAFDVTTTAQLERCAKHIDLIAADWRDVGADQKVWASEYLAKQIRELR